MFEQTGNCRGKGASSRPEVARTACSRNGVRKGALAKRHGSGTEMGVPNVRPTEDV